MLVLVEGLGGGGCELDCGSSKGEGRRRHESVAPGWMSCHGDHAYKLE